MTEPLTADTTTFIVNGTEYFSANLNNGNIRIGVVGLPAIDLPKGHKFFEMAASAANENEVEAAFDQMIEAGVVDPKYV